MKPKLRPLLLTLLLGCANLIIVMASLTYNDYLKAAKSLNCEVAAIRAVADVESSGSGFYLTGGIKKRFEAHLFLRETGVSLSTYEAAKAIDATAALKSTSWGKFQVLGSNYADAGYNSPASMVASYEKNEQNQLNSWVKLIKAWSLTDELRNSQWNAFAAKYNGASYKASYPADMERYYQKYKVDPTQSLIFGYSQSNTIGSFVLLLVVIGGGGYYAYQKGYAQKWFPAIPKINLPKIKLPKII